MKLNGQKLGEQASRKIAESLRHPREASRELKEYIKQSIEISKKVKKR